MTTKEFFDYKIYHKFGFEAAQRVKQYMHTTGLLQGGNINSLEASAALILAGCTATTEDLNNFGRALLSAGEPETLLEIFDMLLSDELNAVTIERIIFDRANGCVVFELIDNSDFTVKLKIPSQPDWNERPAIELKQTYLVSLAMDLQHDEFNAKGALVSETKNNQQ